MERADFPDSRTDVPTAEFDTYAETYEDVVNRSLGFAGLKVDFFTRAKAGYALDLLQEHFDDTSHVRLVDIGCGVGNIHPLLKPGVGSVSGCDVSAASLKIAVERNPDVSYTHYSNERLPYPDGQFDAAMTVCVMHHVPPGQWAGFAAEMKRVLRPGGLAMVFEHNPYNPLTRRAVSDCEFDEDAVLLSQRKTRALLAEAGMDDVESRSILSIPAVGRIGRKLDSAFGRLPFGAQYYARGIA